MKYTGIIASRIDITFQMRDRLYILCYSAYHIVSVLFALLLNIITHPKDLFYNPSTAVTPAPTCLIDPKYGIHEYIIVNGIQLHYVISGPEGAPLMLMLHGFLEFWYSWRFQIREFSRQYRVVALDLPGCGYSEKVTDIVHYNIHRLTNTIIAFIDAIGYDKCVLVGQSLGAVISWNVVRTRPNLFSQLIIMNGPDTSRISFSKLSAKTKSKFWYILIFRLPWIPEYLTRCRNFEFVHHMYRSRSLGLVHQENFSKEDMDALICVLKQKNALTPIFNFYRSNKFVNNSSNTIKITIPTLIIWTDSHNVLTKEIAEESTVTLEQYDLKYLQCSHWVQQDMPNEVNALMREFLQH